MESNWIIEEEPIKYESVIVRCIETYELEAKEFIDVGYLDNFSNWMFWNNEQEVTVTGWMYLPKP